MFGFNTATTGLQAVVFDNPPVLIVAFAQGFDLIEILWANGVTHYDVASIAEVRLVRSALHEAVLCFMHPVKAEEAIAEAYFKHGVRTFSLDSLEELDKIMRATRNAADLTLCVRRWGWVHATDEWGASATHEWAGQRVSPYVPGLARLAELAGLELTDWQRDYVARTVKASFTGHHLHTVYPRHYGRGLPPDTSS